MKPQRGPRVQLDLAQRVVFVQHVHHAQLIEVEAHVRIELRLQHLGPQIDIFGPYQRSHRRALMPLLDLVPPAIDLVAHHRRLFDKQRALGQQRQQRLIRSGHGEKNSQPGKTLTPPAAAIRRPSLLVFAFQLHALPAQPPMHRGQQALGHRRLGQRQQLRLVQAGLRALRLRIEFADGLNLVAEELDAHRPVRLRRIDVENSAAPRELPRHLHQIHLRVAHRGQVPVSTSTSTSSPRLSVTARPA
jgi:hypothetical protein